ncbi:MAG: monomeric [FeFe] hydrogenase [Endomicrobium sp.]|jgi:[FeFe] hydrogenase (group B1/B3)|nr:monomeric [FeFe] hydrogenase [Endomicrobium sp.]
MSVKQFIQLKKEVLIRIIRAFLSGDFANNARLIPFEMRPKGTEVSYRCCIYKERAVLRDRVIAGLGFSIEDDDEITELAQYANRALERKKPHFQPLTIIDIACKGCAATRVFVTDICQGCVARMCMQSCKFNAITFAAGKSVIDAKKCKNCKMCISACPYGAIAQIRVPCEDSCPVDAIEKNENGIARIDYERCISCGKCIINCPFGAVHEKSQIVDVLKNLENKSKGVKIIAMTAPSIAGQFPGDIYQLKSAIIKAGFTDVYEVAMGADITIKNEAAEFDERMKEGVPFMTTSCCAGYNGFIKKHLPDIKKYVSDTKTPLYYTAQKVKSLYPSAITVFIGPCVAKKNEAFYNDNIDYVINYEELGALFIAKNIEVLDCEKSEYGVESSKQGRGFGVTSGVAKAVSFLAKTQSDPVLINGLNKQTINVLKQALREGKCAQGNIVEVMCCENGCVGGNAVICSAKTAQNALNKLLEKSKDIKKEN